MQKRENALRNWLRTLLGSEDYLLKPLTGDASFRRYFRIEYAGFKRIIMDAPPEKEGIETFLNVAAFLRTHHLSVPEIFAFDRESGFALLEDFGDEVLLYQLNQENANSWYALAIEKIIQLQRCPAEQVPPFDAAHMHKELAIFKEWFLHAYLGLSLSTAEQQLIETTLNYVIDEVGKQPLVFIHRDYHSRNLMIIHTPARHNDLGLIDFQDAMRGPFTYDLVSLLKDCYIQWPREQVTAWLQLFYQASALARQERFASFTRAFDFCGLQRHLKVLGVFSRLYLRDNKPNYLKDLPLTLHYVLACLETYEELQPFYEFMQQRIQLP